MGRQKRSVLGIMRMAEYGRKISVSNPPSEFLIYGGINTGSIIVSSYQLVCCNPQVRAINGAGPGAWSSTQDVGKLLPCHVYSFAIHCSSCRV